MGLIWSLDWGARHPPWLRYYVSCGMTYNNNMRQWRILKENMKIYLMINKSFLILFCSSTSRWDFCVCNENPLGRLLSFMIYWNFNKNFLRVAQKRVHPMRKFFFTADQGIFTPPSITCWAAKLLKCNLSARESRHHHRLANQYLHECLPFYYLLDFIKRLLGDKELLHFIEGISVILWTNQRTTYCRIMEISI